MFDNELKLKDSLVQDEINHIESKRRFKKILKRVAIVGGITVVGYITYRYLKNKDTSNDGHILKAMSPNGTIWDFDTNMLRTVKDYYGMVDEDDELLSSLWCADIDDWSDFSCGGRDGYY